MWISSGYRRIPRAHCQKIRWVPTPGVSDIGEKPIMKDTHHLVWTTHTQRFKHKSTDLPNTSPFSSEKHFTTDGNGYKLFSWFLNFSRCVQACACLGIRPLPWKSWGEQGESKTARKHGHHTCWGQGMARLKDSQPGGKGNAGIPGQSGPHHTVKPRLKIKHASDLNSFFNLQILSTL